MSARNSHAVLAAVAANPCRRLAVAARGPQQLEPAPSNPPATRRLEVAVRGGRESGFEFLSLAPGFSRVLGQEHDGQPFQRLSPAAPTAIGGKPLKRFAFAPPTSTRLKPGANEILAVRSKPGLCPSMAQTHSRALADKPATRRLAVAVRGPQQLEPAPSNPPATRRLQVAGTGSTPEIAVVDGPLVLSPISRPAQTFGTGGQECPRYANSFSFSNPPYCSSFVQCTRVSPPWRKRV